MEHHAVEARRRYNHRTATDEQESVWYWQALPRRHTTRPVRAPRIETRARNVRRLGRGRLTGTFGLDQRLGVLEVLCGAALLEAGERCLLEGGVRAETLRVRPSIAQLECRNAFGPRKEKR